jgi:hypothetical protein
MIIAEMIDRKFGQFVCRGTHECAVNGGTGGQAEHLAKNKGRNNLNTESDYATRRSWLPRGPAASPPWSTYSATLWGGGGLLQCNPLHMPRFLFITAETRFAMCHCGKQYLFIGSEVSCSGDYEVGCLLECGA